MKLLQKKYQFLEKYEISELQRILANYKASMDQSVEYSKLLNTNKELLQELEKLQKMVKLQENIANDYKSLLEENKNELQRTKAEFMMKLNDLTRMLDIKNEKIKQLEEELFKYYHKSTPNSLIQLMLISMQKRQ
jgi:hypothetical protein